MPYKDFYKLLKDSRLIEPVWEYILDIIKTEISGTTGEDDYLKLFAIYFSLIGEGNACMSLDVKTLKAKWFDRVNAAEIQQSEDTEFIAADFESIRKESEASIVHMLHNINPANLPEIIGHGRIFEIEDNWLYLRKYYVARKEIISAVINRLFTNNRSVNTTFNYKNFVRADFELSAGQEKAVTEGFSKNLIITGGPGTGKTTSILYLLLNILSADPEYEIYLAAPSGKASSRMKESIVKGIGDLDPSACRSLKNAIETVSRVEGTTIHTLLGYDGNSGGFAYNKKHQFGKKSIFVIDEASMIDVCLFSSLLQAIPDEARVFIMGDRNQLPSVEVGSVFSDLLKISSLADNIIRLDESIRFLKGSTIYNLAEAVNNEETLPVTDKDWQEYNDFRVLTEYSDFPISYYKDIYDDPKLKEKDIFEVFAKRWGEVFFKSLQNESTGLDPADSEKLEALFNKTENAKILCAENKGPRGIKAINRVIKNTFIDETADTSVTGFYPGMLMMVTRNNKLLDLFNGDSGILVSFKDDPILYFMVRKTSALIEKDGKADDKIFKLGEFVFYPLRMITFSDIEMAYAITIHKSQGSDYKNILVILPKKKGHPLLNRQIVYTAITRTKGATYIVSNHDRFAESAAKLITRDTNISG